MPGTVPSTQPPCNDNILKKWRDLTPEEHRARVREQYHKRRAPLLEQATCIKCNETKPRSEFTFKRRTVGVRCNACRIKRLRDNYHANKWQAKDRVYARMYKSVQEIDDNYVKDRLSRQYDIPRDKIPPDLIELKRAIIKAKRTYRGKVDV